jgi:hypothetical protein
LVTWTWTIGLALRVSSWLRGAIPGVIIWWCFWPYALLGLFTPGGCQMGYMDHTILAVINRCFDGEIM